MNVKSTSKYFSYFNKENGCMYANRNYFLNSGIFMDTFAFIHYLGFLQFADSSEELTVTIFNFYRTHNIKSLFLAFTTLATYSDYF